MSNFYTPLNTSVCARITFKLSLIIVFSLFLLSNSHAQNGSSFRTETQEKWGAVPKGNNSAAYMYRKFKAAFPNGITVGCTNKLVFSTPSAITDFLPSNGASTILPLGTQLNPLATYGNILAGQVLALKLNIGFDEYDSRFSASDALLKNMIVKTGIFSRKSVQEILQLAENAVGGCSTPFSLSDLSDVVAKINQNYDNSTADMGFLGFSSITSAVTCVNDHEPPVFKETPQTFTVFTEECYIASWNMPIVNDNCSTVTLTSNINLGECLPVGVHKVVMTATDASGNKSTYAFTITIEQAIYISSDSSSNNTTLVAHSTTKDINLEWVNKDNEKTKLFVVEKANFQGDFEEIKTFIARPFAGYQDYSFIDTKPEKNENSYRIKTVFKDGSVQYSRAQTVNYNDKDFVQVYPSAGADIVNLDLTPYTSQNVQLYLYDEIGKPVYNQFVQLANDRPIKIDVEDLPHGQYMLSIVPQSGKEVTKALFIRN